MAFDFCANGFEFLSARSRETAKTHFVQRGFCCAPSEGRTARSARSINANARRRKCQPLTNNGHITRGLVRKALDYAPIQARCVSASSRRFHVDPAQRLWDQAMIFQRADDDREMLSLRNRDINPYV